MEQVHFVNRSQKTDFLLFGESTFEPNEVKVFRVRKTMNETTDEPRMEQRANNFLLTYQEVSSQGGVIFKFENKIE